MDNKDFDEMFSNKLQETQSFEFRESDWEEVSERIKQPKRKKRAGIWFWMLAAACLLLGLATAYLAIDLNDTKRELAEVQASILSQSSVNSTSSSAEKTIDIAIDKLERSDQTRSENVLKEILDKEDQAIAKSEKIIENNFPSPTNNSIVSITTNSNNKLSPNLLEPTNKKTNSGELSSSTDNEIKTGIATELNSDIETSIVSDLTTAAEITQLSAFPLEIETKEIDFKPSPLTPKTKKESKQRSRLGITAAWALPEKLIESNSENSSIKRKAFDLGLNYSFDITKRINTWAAVSFHTTTYKTENLDRADRASLLEFGDLVLIDNNSVPVGQGASEAESDVTAKQNVLRYSLGANYTFLQKTRWGLYSGLSAQAQTKINNKIFIGGNDDGALVEDSFESNSQGKKEAFRLHAFVAQVGCHFDISKKLSWQFEAYSQLKLAPKSNRIYEPFGLRTIVSYRF